MSERPGLPDAVSVDSSVVLAYLLGEDLGEAARDVFSRDVPVRCSGIAISELFYVLCRKRGERFARGAVETILRSGRVSVASSDEIDIVAGGYKCARSVSLADCYVLAVAKVLKTKALFARREADLAREQRRKPFDVGIVFLEDLAERRGTAI